MNIPQFDLIGNFIEGMKVNPIFTASMLVLFVILVGCAIIAIENRGQ